MAVSRLKATLSALALTLAAASASVVAAELYDPDAAWNLLNMATVAEKIENDRWMAVKTFPEPLRAAAEDFEIEGYVVPILAEPEISAFILVQDPENCPFCGTGSGYAPVLEVILESTMPAVEEFSRIKVTGDLELISDPDTYQMFKLVGAKPLS